MSIFRSLVVDPALKAKAVFVFEPLVRRKFLFALKRFNYLLQDEERRDKFHLTLVYEEMHSDSEDEVVRLVWSLIPLVFSTGIFDLSKMQRAPFLDVLFSCLLDDHSSTGPCGCSRRSGVLLKYYLEMSNRHFELSAAKDKKVKFKRWCHYFIVEIPPPIGTLTFVVPWYPIEHPSATWDLYVYEGTPDSVKKVFISQIFCFTLLNSFFKKHCKRRRDAERYVISKARAEGVFIV